MLGPFRYGFTRIAINEHLLVQGKVSLVAACGHLEEGVSFSCPDQDQLPNARSIPEGVSGQLIYLCIPFDSVERYHRYVSDIQDEHTSDESVSPIELASLNATILLESEDISQYSALAFARIKEVRSDGKVILDENFMPPLLNVKASVIMDQMIEEVHGLLSHRCDVLSRRLSQTQQAESAVIADFMLLQLVNRYESTLSHYTKRSEVHPEQLFCTLSDLMSEISTYTCDERQYIDKIHYQHNHLSECFNPLIQKLRGCLTMVLEQHAQAIELTQEQYGVYVAKILDPSLLENGHFILAVSSDIPVEELKEQIPRQLKISSVNTIRDLVTKGIPGVSISPLAVAPRQIPYHANFAYYELNQSGDIWKDMIDQSSLAMHLGGQFNEVRIELWSIRG